MNAHILPMADVSYIDELFYPTPQRRTKRHLKPVKASRLMEIPVEHLQLWCVTRAVYQPPIEELINWFYIQIRGKKAIEICAGNGSIGRELGIPVTDSWVQTRPDMAEYYKLLGQEPITPPDDVIKMSANEAVETFRPEIVIGSWVTQLWREGYVDGSVEGVDEGRILASDSLEGYILVGNDKPHGNKEINKLPHVTFRFPWLRSRGIEQELNHVRIWGNSKNGPPKR